VALRVVRAEAELGGEDWVALLEAAEGLLPRLGPVTAGVGVNPVHDVRPIHRVGGGEGEVIAPLEPSHNYWCVRVVRPDYVYDLLREILPLGPALSRGKRFGVPAEIGPNRLVEDFVEGHHVIALVVAGDSIPELLDVALGGVADAPQAWEYSSLGGKPMEW